MSHCKPVDLKLEKPFNYKEIIRMIDEYTNMLVSLDIAFPVLSNSIKRNKELKYRIDLIRQRKPHLFND